MTFKEPKTEVREASGAKRRLRVLARCVVAFLMLHVASYAVLSATGGCLSSVLLLLTFFTLALHIRLGLGHWPRPMTVLD